VTKCDQCGFEYESVPVVRIAREIRSLPPRYRALVAELPHSVAARRPEPSVWSALEYTAHVRDMLLVQRDRVIHALVEDRPGFAPMHRDERVELVGYATEDPVTVAAELAVAAELLGRLFARMSDDQFLRKVIYNYPEPAEHDLAWMGQHTVHEGEHHLQDITAVLDRVRRQ
jgi:S-DNA-T family DNA segregation ATPase FtsK/SpoIIIE